MIFEPLQLKNSFRPDSLPPGNVAKGYVLDGTKHEVEPNWKKSNMKGVGCIYSTSSDLLKWLEAMNTTAILNEKNIALIRSPISCYEYYDADFGYSWAINKSTFQTNEPAFFYGGTSLGFFSMITTLPESRITIILLNNKGDFPRIELTSEILRTLSISRK
jgi:CubicO group peptidase (beta-lactamase class C family)